MNRKIVIIIIIILKKFHLRIIQMFSFDVRYTGYAKSPDHLKKKESLHLSTV